MSLSLTVYGKNARKETEWATELTRILKTLVEIQIRPATGDPGPGQLIFIDGSLEHLDSILEKIDRRGRAIFLILGEESSVPNSLLEGKIDDVLIAPFRSLEVISKLRYYEKILMWNEVMEMSASFSEALQKLSEDLGLAERLQKAKLPRRFQSIKGFRVSSRYLAGMRSGGDYFDLAESVDNANVSIIMSHSSTYGLSGAILSALMRVTVKLSSDRVGKAGTAIETVRRVYEELLITLGEKDQLSLFYGTISRGEQVLRFFNLGGTSVFYAEADGDFRVLPHQGDPISKTSGFHPQAEVEVKLLPNSRLALVSKGFVTAMGGRKQVCDLLIRLRRKEAADSLNELIFNVKSKLEDDGDMPVQDCTALIFDVDSRVLKLTKQGQDES